MSVFQGTAADGDRALELATARALLQAANEGVLGETVLVYRPSAPVVVFGRRDTFLPGFTEAVGRASRAGFEPLVRATGGRAVAYTDAAVVVDHVMPEKSPAARLEARFEELGRFYVELLRGLGVESRLGAVPGEYCPGAHSVNARGRTKLVGTAQRVVRRAWLFSALVVVGDEDRLRPVLAEVYDALQQPFDPVSVGSLAAERPGLRAEQVERVLVGAYNAALGPARPAAELPPEVMEPARRLAPDHRP